MKTVGTVMATYNGEKFLEAQLESIIDQTQRPQQIVIVDDRSQDRTRVIIAGYMNRFPGLFCFAKNPVNFGPQKTFEKGLMLCNTDYIALCDQDDVWKPRKIEILHGVLLKNKAAKLCFHDLEIINKNNELRAKSFWEKAPENEPLPVVGRLARERIASFSNPVPGCTVLFDALLKEHILPMPSSAVGHDWWISAVAFFLADPVEIPEALGQYRFHPDQAAGIGTVLSKGKGEKEILPVHLRVIREVKRVFSKKRLKTEKQRVADLRRHAISSEVIKIIDKCFEMELWPQRKKEYQILKEKMKRNLEIL